MWTRNHDKNPGNDVRVVTLTVGGNDIFSPVADNCLAGPSTVCNTAIATAFAGFNGLITAISQQAGATVADTFGALGAGDYVGGADCLHPNKSGHTKIAAIISKTLFAKS